MARHILLEKAYEYAVPNSIDEPTGCTFNHDKGYWTSNITGTPMMEGKHAKKLVTKKCDRETGEDQKGE